VSFSVKVARSAKHELKRPSRDAQKRIASVLLVLKANPFPHGYE
jgi:hypothetical protein